MQIEKIRNPIPADYSAHKTERLVADQNETLTADAVIFEQHKKDQKDNRQQSPEQQEAQHEKEPAQSEEPLHVLA